MGVAHNSLLHNRLTISRVTVSTTLKTPNSLTFCQLRSTTITRDLAEPNKSMDEGNHERLSGGSGKHLRDCHKTAASCPTVTGSGFIRYMIGIHPTILPLAADTTRRMWKSPAKHCGFPPISLTFSP